MTKSANELFHAAAGALLSRAIGPKVPSIQYGSAEKAHVAYMEQISRLNGLTPERYPALFKSFQVAPKNRMYGGGRGSGRHVQRRPSHRLPFGAEGQRPRLRTRDRHPGAVRSEHVCNAHGYKQNR